MRQLPPVLSVLCCVSGVVVFAGDLAACGRSSEVAYVCPRHADDASCKELNDAAEVVGEDLQGQLGSDRDANLANEMGACSASVERTRLDAGCVEDRCAELCALHPCDVLDASGRRADRSTCPARCASLELSNAVVDDVLLRAAEKPGFCTCAVCDTESQALCDTVWDCTVELQGK